MFHSKRWISWRSIHGSLEFLLDIIAVQVNVEHLWHYMGWAWGSMRYMEIPWLIRDAWILEGVMYASHRIHGWCIYLYSRGHSWIHDPLSQGGRGSWWSRRTGGGQGFSNCWKGWKRNQPRKLTQKGSWGFGRIFSGKFLIWGKSRWNIMILARNDGVFTISTGVASISSILFWELHQLWMYTRFTHKTR